MNTNEKLREALEFTYNAINDIEIEPNSWLDGHFAKIMSKVAAALALPRSNCDIYTMEEQSKRHEEYCKSHSTNGRCVKCPLWQMRLLGINCAIAWANLPPDEAFDKEQESEVVK